MKKNQYARYISYIDNEKDREFLIQFVGYDNQGDLRFKMDSGNVSFLTISKNCFPMHEWNSGTKDHPIKRKTIIEVFNTESEAFDYIKQS